MTAAVQTCRHRPTKSRRCQVGGCLGELEERTRRVIRTAFFEGVTYEALAEREAAPVGTMKSWIRRGLLRLRACLDA